MTVRIYQPQEKIPREITSIIFAEESVIWHATSNWNNICTKNFVGVIPFPSKTIDEWERNHYNSDSYVLTIMEEDLVLGWLKFQELSLPLTGTYGFIKDINTDCSVLSIDVLYVNANCRGCGVGTKLLGALAEYAKACGYQYLTLHCNDKNSKGKSLYSKMGFYTLETQWYGYLNQYVDNAPPCDIAYIEDQDDYDIYHLTDRINEAIAKNAILYPQFGKYQEQLYQQQIHEVASVDNPVALIDGGRSIMLPANGYENKITVASISILDPEVAINSQLLLSHLRAYEEIIRRARLPAFINLNSFMNINFEDVGLIRTNLCMVQSVDGLLFKYHKLTDKTRSKTHEFKHLL